MVRIRVEGDYIDLQVLSWDRLWACKSRLRFAGGDVLAVRTLRDEAELNELIKSWGRLTRLAGTLVPCRIAAGMFQSEQGGALFVDVRRPFHNMIQIDLVRGEFRHIFVDVDNPPDVVRSIEQAIPMSGRATIV